MPERRLRLLVLAAVLAVLAPSPAGADWIVSPVVHVYFGGQTNLVEDLDRGPEARKLGGGVSGGFLTDGLLGVEAEFAYAPGFFERDGGLITSSRLTTLTGNVIVALPRAISRESLRPYLTAGLGLLQARTEDVLGELAVDTSMLGLSVGGGAIGELTDRVSLRFDLRRLKTVTGDDSLVLTSGRSRISVWRAGIGVTFRY
ncbi:MAG: outer membrane protein [Vicinamibacterales bacterium]